MRELRLFNRQWHGDLRWPCGRTAMFTVMDHEGRSVATHSIDKEGKIQQRYTFHHDTLTQQQSYPVSARRVR